MFPVTLTSHNFFDSTGMFNRRRPAVPVRPDRRRRQPVHPLQGRQQPRRLPLPRALRVQLQQRERRLQGTGVGAGALHRSFQADVPLPSLSKCSWVGAQRYRYTLILTMGK